MDEWCLGLMGENGDKACTQADKLYHEGFEFQKHKEPSKSFKYSWEVQIPWTVKFSETGIHSNTGDYSLRYYRVPADSGWFWYHTLLPEAGETPPLFSFFTRCTNSDVVWKLQVSVGGALLLTVDNSECNGIWHRHIGSLAGLPAGKTEFKFQMLKDEETGVEIFLDDLAVLVDGCPDTVGCAQYEAIGNSCAITTYEPGFCFIDHDCIAEGTEDPVGECGVCKPFMNTDAWWPDSALCDDGNPDTNDVCDLENSDGCVHTL